MTLRNRSNGLALCITTLPRQKYPSLLIRDELGTVKVAAFLNDDRANDFIAHLEKMLPIKAEEEDE